MADFDLEEWQRQQAAAAVAASQGQPNAIPTQPPAFTNAAARVVAPPNGNGQVLIGASSISGLNRPRSDWGTPAAPNPAVDTTYAQRGLPVAGEQNASDFTGANTVQGIISPSEQQFWANNQNGAIPHPVTGQLIGLGNNPASRQKVYQDLMPPSQIAESTLPSPNFIPVPEIDPAVGARREEIANEIAITQNQLRGASTERGRHGQPSSFDMLSTKLEQLRHADSGLAQHEHQTEVFRAHVTDQNRKMQDEYNVNRDASAANIAMGRITAAPGTDEYKAAMAKIDNDYPYARQDPRVGAAMLKAATFHDERSDIAARAREAGLTEKIEGFGQKGPSIKYVDPNAVPQGVLSRYSKLQANIQNHLELSKQQEQANIAIPEGKGANIPYKGAPALHADQLESSLLEKKYPGLNPQPQTVATPAAHGYDVGAQYGQLIYQGGDPKIRSSWKTIQEQVAQ